MYSRNSLLLVLAVVVWGAVCLDAQSGTPFNFLRFNLAARSAALAGATNGHIEDINTIFMNPAVLPTVTSRPVATTFLKHVLDINSGLAAYTTEVEDVGYVGVSVIYTSYGSFDRADKLGIRQGTFSANDVAFALSYANYIDTLITYGVTAKFIHSALDDLATSAVALDAGVIFQIPHKRTNLALSVCHLGTQLTTLDGTRDKLPVDVRASVNHRLRGLPVLVNFSLIHLADDVTKITDRFLNFAVSGELYIGKAVQVRLGYDNSRRNLSSLNIPGQLSGVSGGLGILLSSFALDYAVSVIGDAALLHRMSVSFDL